MMWELPEIERERKKLDQQFVGRRFRKVVVAKESWLNLPLKELEDQLIGRQLLYVERRSKSIIFHLDDGHRLVLNIGSMGQLLTTLNTENTGYDQEGPKLQLSFGFENGSWNVAGARSMTLQWISARELDEQLKAIGPEPGSRSMSPALLKQRFEKRRSSLKTALSNPAIIAGISSPLADEIAFRAGLLPTVRIESLNDEDYQALFAALSNWLQEAFDVEENGTENIYAVTNRTGEPCVQCGNALEETQINSRTAVFCKHCQHEHVQVPAGSTK
ncbi:DNA-formamidopyrimidine glycosylase family protein [Paenibacillus sp. 1001270B_150601_E10]|uniref:DNA-formamidopyrimidine glycosylase family protein n=1 Tax=Paenibacillus sp. 1001270B_150601_E10 TaxID=2787079 RepID=UPI00189FF130|nr:DNA-formamidopyrimidine glycosylase family protein [Paenibacillus sp. 1001270B_150601_E10]